MTLRPPAAGPIALCALCALVALDLRAQAADADRLEETVEEAPADGDASAPAAAIASALSKPASRNAWASAGPTPLTSVSSVILASIPDVQARSAVVPQAKTTAPRLTRLPRAHTLHITQI